MSEPPVIFSEMACTQLHGEARYKIGVVTLNAPRSLNALSRDMVQAIQYQLDAWQLDPRIVCIWLESSSDKAFCAGGDVRALYYAGREKQGPAARIGEAFFTEEYRLDYSLHVYPKPIIGWGQGIVMGGGMGLLQGCSSRVVTPCSRLAMPEVTIALFPDVCASYFLQQIPAGLGRFIGLTGAIMNAADALFAGLADACLASADKQSVKQGLAALPWSHHWQSNQRQINEYLLSFTTHLSPPADSPLEKNAQTIQQLCHPGATVDVIEAILACDTTDPWLSAAIATLRAGSPLAARIIDEQWQRSRGAGLRDIVQSEMVLATNILHGTEFYEGVRALLIDKDRQPNWAYKTAAEVPDSVVAAYFEPPWECNPLADLPDVHVHVS